MKDHLVIGVDCADTIRILRLIEFASSPFKGRYKPASDGIENWMAVLDEIYSLTWIRRISEELFQKPNRAPRVGVSPHEPI